MQFLKISGINLVSGRISLIQPHWKFIRLEYNLFLNKGIKLHQEINAEFTDVNGKYASTLHLKHLCFETYRCHVIYFMQIQFGCN